MRLTAHCFLFPLALALALASDVSAQTSATLRGEVTDALGGVLPGVTVTVIAKDGQTLATTVTDEVGRYAMPTLPAGAVTVRFELDAFDSAKVDVTLEAGHETVVGERLSLAQFTERIVVVATAPPESPAPPLIVRPRPMPVALSLDEMETICVPTVAGPDADTLATIHSHRYDSTRTIYARGDELNLDAGLDEGLTVGRNLLVRRTFRPLGEESARDAVRGQHTAGLIQIVSAQTHSATGVIVHLCNEVRQGDQLASYTPEPARQAHPAGEPDFDDGIKILFADAAQMLGAAKRLMVIERGGAQGIDVGQRLTIFRRQREAANRPFVIGEAVVVAVRTHSATIRIERATDAVWFGDMAAPQRPSPLATPVRTSGSH